MSAPMPSTRLRRVVAPGAALALALAVGACADLGPVREFGRSAAAVSSYPQAATAYVESARTSAVFVAASPESFVPAAQRQAQVRSALALHAAVGDYFATLARLAGDDLLTLSTLKTVASDARQVVVGGTDRATVDAYAGLTRTLARFAETPARQRAVRELVEEGGPRAMAIVESLRQVAGDWRAAVANDARGVDAVLSVLALPADVPPLMRLLAEDRRAVLARDYAQTLRRMRTAETALAAVETAHAQMVAQLDDLSSPSLRARLQGAAADLRLAAVQLGTPPTEEMP